MKQLVPIQARFLKEGDLIFCFEHRNLSRIHYVTQEGQEHERTGMITKLENIHVDYGQKATTSDNFHPNKIAFTVCKSYYNLFCFFL
jgi:hypothetical protein